MLKLFRGTLVNIKAGSRKELRSIVAKIALWNDPQWYKNPSDSQRLVHL